MEPDDPSGSPDGASAQDKEQFLGPESQQNQLQLLTPTSEKPSVAQSALELGMPMGPLCLRRLQLSNAKHGPWGRMAGS